MACHTTQKTQATNSSTPALNEKAMSLPTNTSPKWRLIHTGGMGMSEEANNFIIKSESEWQKVWTETNKRFEPIPAMPNVDFTKEWVIACMQGTCNSGGYSVQVADIKATNEEVKIQVTQNIPGKNCMSIDLMTYPFTFVAIEQYTQAKTSFEVKKEAKDCK